MWETLGNFLIVLYLLYKNLERMELPIQQCRSSLQACVDLQLIVVTARRVQRVDSTDDRSSILVIYVLPLISANQYYPVIVWFEITQYNDERAILISNLVETVWISRYPIPMDITYDQGL